MSARQCVLRAVGAAGVVCLQAVAQAGITNPFSVPSVGPLSVGIGNAVVFDTDTAQVRVNGIVAFTGAISDQNGQANPANGIPSLAVFSFDSIDLGAGVPISVTGSRGLSLLSRGDVSIRGAIALNGGDFGAAGAGGGFNGATELTNDGAGPGGGKKTSIGNYAGAGGGGFGGAGGRGGGYTETDSLGGAAYGSSPYTALHGGSGGGLGVNGGTYGYGGGGGGAIEISAIGRVQLYNTLSANGGAAGVAANGYGGGGGGSGGSIRVAGRTVELLGGSIRANGSDGGPAFGGSGFNAGGGGGGGRILIQQSGGNLASGVTANGGAAIGSVALPGEAGVVQQTNATLLAPSANLYVRLGTGPVSGLVGLIRASPGNNDVFGYIDHVGTGFSGVTQGSTFEFVGLVGGVTVQPFNVTYATSSRTSDTITVKSNGGDATLATGRGVGPIFASNMGTHPDTTINVGGATIGSTAAFHLIVHNASTDLGADSPLTSLGILDIEILGPDADAFSFDPLIPSTLFEQQYANLPIYFDPTQEREYHATLRITTDEGAANGVAGAVYSYALRGGGLALVPEPSTLTGLALATLVLKRRRVPALAGRQDDFITPAH